MLRWWIEVEMEIVGKGQWLGLPARASSGNLQQLEFLAWFQRHQTQRIRPPRYLNSNKNKVEFCDNIQELCSPLYSDNQMPMTL
jgi:hypothetical protein